MNKRPKRILFFVLKIIYSFLATLYLFTVGFLFSKKNRILINQIFEHFNPFLKKIPPIIPETHLAKIIEVKSSLVVEPFGIKGNVNLFELVTLNLFVRAFNPKTIFEIGTFDGRTTLNLAANSSPETAVYTINIPPNVTSTLPVTPDDKGLIDEKVISPRFLNEKWAAERHKITQLYGDTAAFDFTPYLNTIDMVFVDGSHSFEYVMNDSKIAFKLLRDRKGLIVWHDYNSSHQGVTKALNKLQSENPELKMLHIEGTTLVCLIH